MEDSDLKMKDIGEFEFIRSIQRNCHYSPSKVIQGIGDDCAVIGPYEDRVFLITTDLLLEDVHFILKKISPEHIGEKAVNVNLSDIAAMGGDARHLFVSLAIPKQMRAETARLIYTGIKTACRMHNVNILGGDTSASPDKLMINVTVIGEARKKEVLYRNGARAGDGIYTTGTLGDSAAGLMLIMEEASAPKPLASALIKAHNRPKPYLEAGRMIAQSRLASAMIDLSDGLASDLWRICESSRVGARLEQNALPLSEELKAFADLNHLDPLHLALSGGEDYRLLITVPQKNAVQFQKMFKRSDLCQIFCLGEITEDGGIETIAPNGSCKRLDFKGFDHFRAAPLFEI